MKTRNIVLSVLLVAIIALPIYSIILQPINGFNLAMRALCEKDYVSASYYFRLNIKRFKCFHLSEKEHYYLAISYRHLGCVKKADHHLKISLDSDCGYSKHISEEYAPLYPLRLGDTTKALKLLKSQEPRFGTKILDSIFACIIENRNNDLSIEFIKSIIPVEYGSGDKIYPTWKARFKYVNDNWKFIDECDFSETQKNYIYFALLSIERTIPPKEIKKISTTTHVDFARLLFAKGLYNSGLEDYSRARKCIDYSKHLLQMLSPQIETSRQQDFLKQQDEFLEKSDFIRFQEDYDSKKLKKHLKMMKKSFSELQPVFVDKEIQELYNNLMKVPL